MYCKKCDVKFPKTKTTGWIDPELNLMFCRYNCSVCGEEVHRKSAPMSPEVRKLWYGQYKTRKEVVKDDRQGTRRDSKLHGRPASKSTRLHLL